MNAYTPMQTLTKVQRELWGAIHQIVTVERQIIRTSKVWADLVDVENVLRQTVGEVERIRKTNAGFLEKPLNIRQAEEFALKAQLAKARSAVASALKDVEDGPSHK